ncbi:sialin-like [Bacillus rossius redtenbacheri]|uniref:sialin-like n=1 Tax=Bacillus rossius redtenbacheri TaxID=93214 RepID=UPI002FDE127A
MKAVSGGCLRRVPARFVVLSILCLGTICQYNIKVGFSVAIVAMVQPSNSSEVSAGGEQACPGAATPGNSSSDDEHKRYDFAWDESLQGVLLSAFYYGYVATQLLGGRLSEMLGTKRVIGGGIGLAGALFALSPVMARWHVGALVAARVGHGMLCGVFFPSLQGIFSKWFPREEHQTFSGVLNSFMYIGTITAMGVTGVLAAAAWELVFYVYGALAIAWSALCFLLLHDSPEQHPSISPAERHYILKDSARETSKASHPVPWCAILSSAPLWATILSQTGGNFISYTFLSELPTYMKNILKFNISDSGVVSALPYVSAWLGCVGSGYLSQLLQRRGWSRLACYRVFNGINAIGPAVCLLAITFVGCQTTAIVLLLVVANLFYATFYGGGSVANALDLGINFTGTLYGMNLTVANSMGIVTALVAGALTNNNQTRGQWEKVFYIAIAFSVAPYLMFLFCGSTEEQPWNKIKEKDDENQNATTADKKTENEQQKSTP